MPRNKAAHAWIINECKLDMRKLFKGGHMVERDAKSYKNTHTHTKSIKREIFNTFALWNTPPCAHAHFHIKPIETFWVSLSKKQEKTLTLMAPKLEYPTHIKTFTYKNLICIV